MKKLLKKMTSKQKLTIGVVIVIFIISMVCIIVSKQNSPDRVVEKYCNLLDKENFSDILDIAYLPEGELVTKDKIEELKTVYFKKMQKENKGITNCTFTKANETSETIVYKLIIERGNSKETSNIEVRKKDNKIVVDGLYKEKNLTVFKGSTVYIDNKKISVESKVKDSNDGNQVETYTFTILDGVDYDVKITHPIFKDEITTMTKYKEYTSLPQWQLKEDYAKKLNADVNKICNEIVRVSLEKGDIKSLNDYFLNNDSEKKFLNNDKLYQNDGDQENYNCKFKGVSDTLIENVEYINDNELLIKTRTSYQDIISVKNGSQIISDEGKMVDSYVKGFDKELEMRLVKKDDEWKISN